MRFMNDYEIDQRLHEALYAEAECDNPQPNRIALIKSVGALRVWADQNSDGWAYWPKPAKAAGRAMEAIVGDITKRSWELPDISREELTKALSPIKAFLSRQGVDWRTILSPATS